MWTLAFTFMMLLQVATCSELDTYLFSGFYFGTMGKIEGMRAEAEQWEGIVGSAVIRPLEPRFFKITSRLRYCTGLQK